MNGKQRWVGWGAAVWVACGIAAAAVPAPRRLLLQVRDLAGQPQAGIQLAFGGVRSQPTDASGAAELELPVGLQVGQPITVVLAGGGKEPAEWFLVDDQVTVTAYPASLKLMKRSEMRAIGEAALRAGRSVGGSDGATAADEREGVLVEEAKRRGLSREQLEKAISSFAKTGNDEDLGIAAFLNGHFPRAEELLGRAAGKEKEHTAEVLRYLGAAQYEDGKYRQAAGTFRTALALRPDDSLLLAWLGRSLCRLAEWAEAEKVLRRVLKEDEEQRGKDGPYLSADLENLAQLLQDASRLAEAEPLLRRALAIDEHSFGPNHPNVAVRLNNLALLLQATNRLAEAEPLLRRALAIDEHSFGPEHAEAATGLNNLAQLLQATNRLAEAESLMRRALAIDEHSLGPDHPNVATALNNLAQLLTGTDHLAEAEPLLRRALAIDERSFGPDHPNVARDRNNLALLLQATDRLAEAEPLIRRALAIDEHSFGPDHPNVATRLNNLAMLLQATDRLAEAEPLMRRNVSILLAFARTQGHEHPNAAAGVANYRALLKALGRSPAEIEATIEALRAGR